MRHQTARNAAVASSLFAAVAVLVGGQANAAPDSKAAAPQARDAIRSPLARSPELVDAIGKANIPAKARDALLADYDKLPPGARALADGLVGVKPSAVDAPWMPSIPIDLEALAQALAAAKPKVANVTPERGATGDYAFVLGDNLKGGSVRFDGAEVPTFPFGSALAFQVPAGYARGSSHQVTVSNGAFGTSNSDSFKVVAPEGYRGRWGFRFGNFSTPSMSWSIYRNYFTPSAVEYANGTHRPAAQAWFDSTYRFVGNGGDCFGMSVRSVRARLQDWSGIASSWWPSNQKPLVWDYPFAAEVAESVRQDQGGQLAAQAAAIINFR